MIKFYLSGVEKELKLLDRSFFKGYPAFGAEFAYPFLRASESNINLIRRWVTNYNMRIYVTSGVEAIDRKSTSSSLTEKIIQKIGIDAYFEEYITWLKDNKNLYENAFEFYSQSIPLQKIQEFRERYIEEGLSNRIILLFDWKDGMSFVSDWINRGIEWFALLYPEQKPEMVKDYAKRIKEMGGKFHLFSFHNFDLKSMKDYVESTDSGYWAHTSRLEIIFILNQGRLKKYKLDNKDAVNACLQNRFWNVFPDDMIEKVITGKSLHPYNIWNAYQMQLYISHINDSIPAYKEYIDNGSELPAFAEGNDSLGRDKVKEIAKFKVPKNGLFSKRLQEFAVACNHCPIADRCPIYKKDSLCGYTKIWKVTGALNTRNVDSITRSLEDLIGEQRNRLLRAQLIESIEGGRPQKDVTQLQNDMIRNVEILYKLKFGSGNRNKFNILNIGKTDMIMTTNPDDVLSELRDSFGKDIEEKMKKRMEENTIEGEEDDSTTDS